MCAEDMAASLGMVRREILREKTTTKENPCLGSKITNFICAYGYVQMHGIFVCGAYV